MQISEKDALPIQICALWPCEWLDRAQIQSDEGTEAHAYSEGLVRGFPCAFVGICFCAWSRLAIS